MGIDLSKVVGLGPFKAPAPNIPWPCADCGGMHRSGDSLLVRSRHDEGSPEWAAFVCPTCGDGIRAAVAERLAGR